MPPLVAASVEESALASLDRLPPFSPVLNRLLATLSDDDVPFSKLADLIEKDAVLTGNVLRLVNSVLFGFRGTVNSVRHAVAILGVLKLRNVVLSLSITRMWRNVRTPEGWSAASFNVHSVAAGVLADQLAQYTPVPYPEGAFVAGLLHDLGKLLLAVSSPEIFKAVRSRYHHGTPWEVCEMEICGTTHAALSAAALDRWNIPEAIQRAVAFHHEPGQASGGQLDLSHVIEAADQLAMELGYPAVPAPSGSRDRSKSPGSSQALEALGVADRVPRLLEAFRPEFESMRQFF